MISYVCVPRVAEQPQCCAHSRTWSSGTMLFGDGSATAEAGFFSLHRVAVYQALDLVAFGVSTCHRFLCHPRDLAMPCVGTAGYYTATTQHKQFSLVSICLYSLCTAVLYYPKIPSLIVKAAVLCQSRARARRLSDPGTDFEFVWSAPPTHA